MGEKLSKLTLFLISAIVIFSVVVLAESLATEPHQFQGNVTINGKPAGDYMTIRARLNGSTLEAEYTKNGTYGISQNFTVPDRGFELNISEGSIIDFLVEDTYAANATFEQGSHTWLNLSIDGDLGQCGDNICSNRDSCTRCSFDCGTCLGSEISITSNTLTNLSTQRNDTWLNFTTNENAVCEAKLENCSIRTVNTQDYTLSEGEGNSYVFNGKTYDVYTDFVGSTTAKFTINGEVTQSLQKGANQTLNDGTLIFLKDIVLQEFAGGIRKATFSLSASATICEMEYPKHMLPETGRQNHAEHLSDYSQDTNQGEWKSLTLECAGESRNAKNFTFDFYLDSFPPAINITSPPNDSNVTTASISLNVTTTENASCVYYISWCETHQLQNPGEDVSLAGGEEIPVPAPATGGGGGGMRSSCNSDVQPSQNGLTTNNGLSHVTPLTGMSDTFPNAYYIITVNCTDNALNSGANSVRFTKDSNPPDFLNISATNITNSSAIISWFTTEEANASLEYGSASFENIINISGFKSSHNLTLTNLSLQGTRYNYRITATDLLGNKKTSRGYFFHTAVSRQSLQELRNNGTSEVRGDGSNASILISSSTNISVNITISECTDTPVDKNIDVNKLRYLEINSDGNLSQSLSFVVIKMFYSDNDLRAQNISESTLRMYWYNTSQKEWVRLGTNLGWVYGTGVDETNNFVWANVSHFSSYGAGGLVADGYACASNSQCASNYCSSNACATLPTSSSASPSSSTSTSNSGGGGGGGGLPAKKTANITVNKSLEKTVVIAAVNTTNTTAAKPNQTEKANQTIGPITGMTVAVPKYGANLRLWPAVAILVLPAALITLIRMRKKKARILFKKP